MRTGWNGLRPSISRKVCTVIPQLYPTLFERIKCSRQEFAETRLNDAVGPPDVDQHDRQIGAELGQDLPAGAAGGAAGAGRNDQPRELSLVGGDGSKDRGPLGTSG